MQKGSKLSDEQRQKISEGMRKMKLPSDPDFSSDLKFLRYLRLNQEKRLRSEGKPLPWELP